MGDVTEAPTTLAASSRWDVFTVTNHDIIRGRRRRCVVWVWYFWPGIGILDSDYDPMSGQRSFNEHDSPQEVVTSRINVSGEIFRQGVSKFVFGSFLIELVTRFPPQFVNYPLRSCLEIRSNSQGYWNISGIEGTQPERARFRSQFVSARLESIPSPISVHTRYWFHGLIHVWESATIFFRG